MDSATPAMYCLTAWGQWAVLLLQCTASLPGGSGQCNSCNALPVLCCVVLCCVVLCCVVLCCVVLCCVVLCCVALRCVALCCVVLCCVVLCCVVLCCVVLCCVVLCCVVLCWVLCCFVLCCAALRCMVWCGVVCFVVLCRVVLGRVRLGLRWVGVGPQFVCPLAQPSRATASSMPGLRWGGRRPMRLQHPHAGEQQKRGGGGRNAIHASIHFVAVNCSLYPPTDITHEGASKNGMRVGLFAHGGARASM